MRYTPRSSRPWLPTSLRKQGEYDVSVSGSCAFGEHLVDKPADHRVLGRADEVEVLALDLVHHRFHLGEGHDALDNVAVHHKGRNDVGKALFVDHEIARVGKHRLVQPRDIAQQIVKAHARDASGGFLIDAAEALP